MPGVRLCARVQDFTDFQHLHGSFGTAGVGASSSLGVWAHHTCSHMGSHAATTGSRVYLMVPTGGAGVYELFIEVATASDDLVVTRFTLIVGATPVDILPPRNCPGAPALAPAMASALSTQPGDPGPYGRV